MYVAFLSLVVESILFTAVGYGIGLILNKLAKDFFTEVVYLVVGFFVAIFAGPFSVLGLILFLNKNKLLKQWHLSLVLIPYLVVMPESWQNNHIVTLGVSVILALIFMVGYILIIGFMNKERNTEAIMLHSSETKLIKVIEHCLFVLVLGSIIHVVYDTYLDYQILTFVYNLPVLKEASLMILSRNVMVSPVYMIFDHALSGLLALVSLVVLFAIYRFKYMLVTFAYLGMCLSMLLILSMLI